MSGRIYVLLISSASTVVVQDQKRETNDGSKRSLQNSALNERLILT